MGMEIAAAIPEGVLSDKASIAGWQSADILNAMDIFLFRMRLFYCLSVRFLVLLCRMHGVVITMGVRHDGGKRWF